MTSVSKSDIDRFKKAAEAGDPAGMYNLALALDLSGKKAEALKWYEKCAGLGFEQGIFNFANLLHELGRTEEAISWHRINVKNGHVNSMINLGAYLADTHEAESIKLYKRAAELDHPLGMANLGRALHKKGKSQEALEWLLKSIDYGHLTSHHDLAAVYLSLDSKDKALFHLKASSDLGNSESMLGAGGILESNGDLKGAEEYYLKALDTGNLSAYWNLGMLSDAKGDQDQAIQWFKIGAESGDVDSMNAYGVCLLESGETQLAKDWYRKSAKRGNEKAQFNLGLLYSETGNSQQAIKWFEEAIESGSTDAYDELGIVYLNKGNNEVALEWFTKSANLGDPLGMVHLGDTYERLNDLKKATIWWEKAAKLGNADACLYLGQYFGSKHNYEVAKEWWKSGLSIEGATFLVRALNAVEDDEKSASIWQAASETLPLEDLSQLAISDNSKTKEWWSNYGWMLDLAQSWLDGDKQMSVQLIHQQSLPLLDEISHKFFEEWRWAKEEGVGNLANHINAIEDAFKFAGLRTGDEFTLYRFADYPLRKADMSIVEGLKCHFDGTIYMGVAEFAGAALAADLVPNTYFNSQNFSVIRTGFDCHAAVFRIQHKEFTQPIGLVVKTYGPWTASWFGENFVEGLEDMVEEEELDRSVSPALVLDGIQKALEINKPFEVAELLGVSSYTIGSNDESEIEVDFQLDQWITVSMPGTYRTFALNTDYAEITLDGDGDIDWNESATLFINEKAMDILGLSQMRQKSMNQVDELINVLLKKSTSESELRAIADAHELNPKCGRQCQLCNNFAAKIFEIRDEFPDTWFWIGEAIANHPNCSVELQNEIQAWVDEKGDGEWSRKMREAIIANINIDLEKLKKFGISTENSGELWEVKHHPRLTDEVRGQILQARGWHDWPSDDYLSEHVYIFEDSEDLEDIQIDPDAYYK